MKHKFDTWNLRFFCPHFQQSSNIANAYSDQVFVRENGNFVKSLLAPNTFIYYHKKMKKTKTGSEAFFGDWLWKLENDTSIWLMIVTDDFSVSECECVFFCVEKRLLSVHLHIITICINI